MMSHEVLPGAATSGAPPDIRPRARARAKVTRKGRTVGRDRRTVAVKLIDMLGEEVVTTHPFPAAGG
jgi:hypothetical protein